MPDAFNDNSHLPDRCLTFRELRLLAPYSRMHIGRMEKAGQFPKRIRLSPGRVVWRLRDVEAWLADRAS